jgi:hypothetical protein
LTDKQLAAWKGLIFVTAFGDYDELNDRANSAIAGRNMKSQRAEGTIWPFSPKRTDLPEDTSPCRAGIRFASALNKTPAALY